MLRQFCERDGFPREAMLAARDQRSEVVPRFLEVIDEAVATDVEDLADPSSLLIIFHLLGEWRETSAYRPLARLLQSDSEKLEFALGDAITETSCRIMAGVFDGDPQPLYEIILERDADEFVRSQMCLALAMVASNGQLDRDEAARFLRDGFMNILPQADHPVWTGWQQSIAVLGLSELKPLVEKAFEREYIGPYVSTYEHFLKDLKQGVKRPGGPEAAPGFDLTFLDDAVEELSRWAAFKPDDESDKRDDPSWPNLAGASAKPIVNPYRNVGRNDPCPCGSGKKFKKCCQQGLGAGSGQATGLS